MTTVEQAIATHYIAGLHFWARRTDNTVDVVCQNPLGAVEYSIHTATGEGITIVHSPSLIHGWADDVTIHCPVQGGRCYEGHSAQSFRELILPILEDGNMPRVLDKLAEMHEGTFRSGVAA